MKACSLILYDIIDYGIEVDLWAFGVMLFELFAGFNPFFERNPRKQCDNIVNMRINWPPYMQSCVRVLPKY